jgi:hypothetical protein
MCVAFSRKHRVASEKPSFVSHVNSVWPNWHHPGKKRKARRDAGLDWLGASALAFNV